YLNFGADWRSDFSVRIAKSIIDENPDWEEGLENLKDKTIEVRGWIERRNGPQIVISRPEEIAVVDAFESLPGPLARRRLMPGAAAPARLPDLPDLTGPMPEPSHGAPKEKRPEPRAPGDVNL
ncbi:MAG: thermonuclease family protein, partial [Hyphomicrobium sp.]